MPERMPKWCKYANTLLTAYFIFGIPTLLFYAIFTSALVLSVSYATAGDHLVAFGSWAGIIIPLLYLYLSTKRRQRKINEIVSKIKATGHFSPDKSLEFRCFWQSIYLGLDINKGTILYVSIWPGKVIDVVGFTANAFIKTEQDGSKICLYTQLVTLPTIAMQLVTTPPASRIVNTIHAMERKGYSYSVNFPQIVRNHRKECEQISGLLVPDFY